MIPEETLYPVLLPVPGKALGLRGRQRRRSLMAHARKAVAISAQHRGVDLGVLRKGKKGAPIPVNGVFWSLSHKAGWVCGVVAPWPVGIDVEFLRPPSEALIKRVIRDPEWRLSHEEPTLRFFRFWTAKEAVLKATGDGLSGLSRCRIAAVSGKRHLTVAYGKTFWEIEHFFCQDHIASITCGPCRIVWIAPHPPAAKDQDP